MSTQAQLAKLFSKPARPVRPRVGTQSRKVYDALYHGIAKGDKYVEINAHDLGMKSIVPTTLYRPLEALDLLIKFPGRKRLKSKGVRVIKKFGKNRIARAIVRVR